MAALVNILLNGLFLKRFGYQFGAISTLISYLALLIFHMIIVNFVIKKNVTDNVFVIAIALLVLGMTFALHSCLDSLIHRLFIGIVCEGIITVIALGLYKKHGNPNFNLE